MVSKRVLILEEIKAYRLSHHGLSPTLGEIAGKLGIGKTTVHYHVRGMLADGELVRDGHVRGLIPVELKGKDE